VSRFRWRRGHTLLQLVAALAIVAVLVLAALPAYRESRMRGYMAEARQIAREWAHLARAWYLERGSWAGASDQAIGWANPNSRFWIYGPHRYGPEGFPEEAWFVATLRPGIASGAALAQTQTPDYLFVLRPTGEIAECGAVPRRDCQGRNTAGGPPPQDPPGNLRVLAVTSDSISVAWDDTPTETSYTVRWRQSQVGSWQGQAALAQDTTSYTVQDLQPETEYLIQVEATGPGGTAAAGPISATTHGVPPPAATNLQVTGATDSSISLSWQDNATNETGYRVEHRLQGAPSWTQGPNLPADTTSHTVTGLQPNTAYELRVVAFNSWGSTPSQAIQATTPGPPAAPTNLEASSVTTSSALLSWQDNATNETGYLVEYRRSGESSWIQLSIQANSTQHRISGLSPNTTYEARVGAFNQYGTGYSGTLQFSTPPSGDLVTQIWPGTFNSGGNITVHWSPVPGAQRYRLGAASSPGGPLTYHCTGTTSTSCTFSSSGSSYWYVTVEVWPANGSGYSSGGLRLLVRGETRAQAFSEPKIASIRIFSMAHFYTAAGSGATAYKAVRYRRVGSTSWTEVSIPSSRDIDYYISNLADYDCFEIQYLVASTPQPGNVVVSTGWQDTYPAPQQCSHTEHVTVLWTTQTTVAWQAVPEAAEYQVVGYPLSSDNTCYPSMNLTTSGTSAAISSGVSVIVIHPRHSLALNSSGRKTFRLSSIFITRTAPRLSASSGTIRVDYMHAFLSGCTTTAGNLTTARFVRYREANTSQEWITVSLPVNQTSWSTSVTPGRCYSVETRADGVSTSGRRVENVTTGWRPTNPASVCVP